MIEPTALNLQVFDYYSYNVMRNFVFAEQKPVIQSTYTYEENGVYYCASGTEKGVYRYSYCLNNPLKYVDPTGQRWQDVDDWVERVVDGRTEVYYDRDVKSQADVDKKYGKNSGVKHLADGSIVGNGLYTVYNDLINNINGIMKDANGNIVNNDRNIIYGDGYILFAGVTDGSVNAATLHKNLFGSSYIGPNNPQSYGNTTFGIRPTDNYDYRPTWSPTEMAAYRHDLRYDALNVKGIWGAISNRTKCADLILIQDCKQIMNDPNVSAYERSRASKMSTGFSIINFFFKTPHR
ncbi:MAG: hypothetical protein LBI45_02325 [Bacteroidales bacterium]|jgi:hypothetical protein|nr:hypothetical protein [Bacteroidales bacterium]